MSRSTLAPTDARRLSRVEFIALIGVVFATVAFSIDAMLPALPDIAAELSPGQPNRAQLILTSFVLGLGAGTLVAGPLSDTFGRKPVILAGAGVYMLGAALAYVAPTLELMLAARVLQGIGAAAPRTVSLALVRDLYAGRPMAQIVSYAMLIFTLFPAIAPMIGAAIIAGFGWRTIFVAFLVFSVLSIGWLMVRQPETLPREARRPLQTAALAAGAREVLGHRQVQLSILVQTAVFAILFGVLSSIQPAFDVTFGRAESFPYWFALIALASAPAAPINGVLVMRLGMRYLVRTTLIVQLVLSLAVGAGLASGAFGDAAFWVFLGWTISLFATAAFTIGNLNALALEPMGHVAGLASSLMGSISTIGGALLGAAVGQFFNGTPVPLAFAVVIFAAIGGALTARIR